MTALPRGADVRVTRDGATTLAGVAPTNIVLPLGREVTVSVSAQGYTALTKTVIATRDNEPLRFKLEPVSYVLVVRSPIGAEIAVGGTTVTSPAPLELGHLAGDISVSIAKDGYRRMTRPVRLEEFSERDGKLRAEIDVALSPMPGATIAPKATPIPEARRPARRGARSTGASALPSPDEPAPEAKPAKAPAPPAPPPLPTTP